MNPLTSISLVVAMARNRVIGRGGDLPWRLPNDLRHFNKRPDNNDMLFLYAHYKQAAEGDVSGSRPGMLDMVGRAKYDAWAKLKGMKSDDAMKKYVDKVASLLKTHK